IAVHFDSSDLPQLAKFFYRQSVEERNHAMMLVQYLIDRGVPASRLICSVTARSRSSARAMASRGVSKVLRTGSTAGISAGT
ncbi:ferritin-like domain-containing protein, partial [Mycolicibacterium austroafricanum]|uniref:ferritin-like domain-containing protein n=1 Tax=Mycolicibacterium austroafricanum TaxID=39687 RepID=UPI000D41095E